MILKYNCLICSKYCENNLNKAKRLRLFLNFDNNREHRPICEDCKIGLAKKLVKECFINPLDKGYKKPKNLFIKEPQKSLDSFI